MSKPAYNENFRHCCNEIKLDFSTNAKTIGDMYNADESSRLLVFYLSVGPISNKDASTSTIRSLADYGWQGSSQLSSLERRLLASSGISSFCMLSSEKIDATLESMDLTGKICPIHPRAVIQRTIKKIHLKEDGQIKIDYVDQNRMQCLFRHIRNSFAHGLTYELSDDVLLLEDQAGHQDKSITARILVKKQTLIDWIDIIKKGPTES